MKQVIVSVPGKVHLMGEHAVVYGKPALLAAVNLRMTVTIEPSKKTEIISNEPTEHAAYAVDFLLKHLNINNPAPFKLTINSQIPSGYHLGSSAAVAVGITGAIMYYFKKLWNPIRINELAYEIEKKQHGNPSGGDNTTVTVGGFVWFRKELEFLKSIWQLPFKPHASLNHFFLIKTKRPSETTGEMVALVKQRMQKDPEQMQKVLDLNETQVKRITVGLKEGNEKELLDAIRIGESTLERMGVVSKKVMPLIRTIEKEGGAAKILGGGGVKDGVGYLLCYQHDMHRVEILCKTYGFSVQQIILGEDGIRLESNH